MSMRKLEKEKLFFQQLSTMLLLGASIKDYLDTIRDKDTDASLKSAVDFITKTDPRLAMDVIRAGYYNMIEKSVLDDCLLSNPGFLQMIKPEDINADTMLAVLTNHREAYMYVPDNLFVEDFILQVLYMNPSCLLSAAFRKKMEKANLFVPAILKRVRDFARFMNLNPLCFIPLQYGTLAEIESMVKDSDADTLGRYLIGLDCTAENETKTKALVKFIISHKWNAIIYVPDKFRTLDCLKKIYDVSDGKVMREKTILSLFKQDDVNSVKELYKKTAAKK